MIKQSFKMAFKAILSNKMRSFLTMLGVIIGVIALVVLVSLVSGATDSITSQVASLGTNMLSVTVIDDKANPLRLEDLSIFTDHAEIAAVAPVTQLSATAVHGSTDKRASIYGTTASYADVQNAPLLYGRFLKSSDVENHTSVCVIDYAGAETLFGRTDVVGEVITLDGRAFQIVGVLEEGDSMMAMFLGGTVTAYIPYTTAQRMSVASSNVSSFYVSAVDKESMDAAEAALKEILMIRFRQDKNAFRVFNQSTLMDTMGSITSTLSLLLGGIAAISLLVGGIGIMNIMLVSVTERTREIGIRKAIGASRRSILMQFLIEAMALSLIGCAIGVLLSWGILGLVTLIANNNLLRFGLSLSVVGVAVFFSVGIGVLFGLYPANKAAKKNPIEALRYAG